jgi:hypothetical protein
VRSRRNDDRRSYARAPGAGSSVALRIWGRATRRPVDTAAVLVAAAASLVIIINAVFLQSGSHPAPFFANAVPAPAVTEIRPRLVVPAAPVAMPVPVRPAVNTSAPQPVAARRNDPIADLIAPSPRVTAVQKTLAQYGYGQIKPTGILDDATSTAIEKFERERKLPVTGRISDRLMSDLAAMVGHPLD